MLRNKSSAWVSVQVFQLVLLFKLKVGTKLDKDSYKETKHVLENYGRGKKIKNLCLSSLNMYCNRLHKIYQAEKYIMVNFSSFSVFV